MSWQLRIQYVDVGIMLPAEVILTRIYSIAIGTKRNFLRFSVVLLKYISSVACVRLNDQPLRLIVKTPKANLRDFMSHFNISYTRYFNKTFGRSGQLLYQHGDLNQREIGEIMNVDYSSVSVARKRLSERLGIDAQLKREFLEIESKLV
jgi:hypothetical protein